MASPLEKLVRKADALAVSADRLVAETLRGIRGELAVLAKELKLASSAADRETAYKAIRTRMAKLAVRLDRLLAAQHQLAAKTAARAASDMTGVEIKYSARHAQAVLELVSPAQGENLAAVFTDRMSQSLVNTLRESVVAVLREQAVAGGSVKDAARAMQERWDAALENETPRFTDAAGRVWDTKTYFMMNARTSTMRVYNDCLVDDVARQTGSDLMRISRGGSDPHCACAAWEGQIVSLSGKTKGFPTYEDARRGGCFHPNCVHTLEVVDAEADADEIALQKAHPVAKADAADPDAQRARKYARDQERKRKTEGLTAEEARLAVDRDNLAAAIRAGLLRADAKALVAKLTDAQVSALCPDGMPPRFAPVKKVPGGTRKSPKHEPERWRRGTRGGVVHIARDTDAAHLVAVAKLADTAKTKEKPMPKGGIDWYLARMGDVRGKSTQEIVDSILSVEFGVKAVDSERGYFRMRKVTDEATRLATAKMAVVVLRDLKERFPNAPVSLDGLCFRQSSKSATACASLDHKYGKDAVMHIAWDARFGNADIWENNIRRESETGVKWTQGHYDIRMNFDVFRHEFGHILTTGDVEKAFEPVYKAVGGKKYFKTHVSAYGGTSQAEAIAESFAAITAHDYKQGTLDKRLEDFVKYVMLKESKE